MKRAIVVLALALALAGCGQASNQAIHPHGRYEVVDAHGKPFAFCPTYEQAVYQVLYWHDGLQIVEVSPTSSWDQ